MAAEDSVATEHQSKRLRLYSEEDVVLNDEEYEEALESLKDEYNYKKRDVTTRL